jgi:hypothetical protein
VSCPGSPLTNHEARPGALSPGHATPQPDAPAPTGHEIEGPVNHSSVITLLDPSGVILARVEGLGQPHDALREALHALH